jgi:hypothetical protein
MEYEMRGSHRDYLELVEDGWTPAGTYMCNNPDLVIRSDTHEVVTHSGNVYRVSLHDNHRGSYHWARRSVRYGHWEKFLPFSEVVGVRWAPLIGYLKGMLPCNYEVLRRVTS